ncbi:hypothetical protein ONZ45_g16853 [Pleurotus djamor]|nr:hypothetical protein ONZ45_g16853 [Pleurotus djamor]
MPPKVDQSVLFHNRRKKPTAVSTPPSTSTSPIKRSAHPRPKPDANAEDDSLKLPDGPYQEFRLMSSALNGWKYDVMKFDSRKPVDISTWQAPIKLNRKELRREDNTAEAVPEAVGPMLGPDGKPVIGADGRVVMVDAEGRPIHPTNNSGQSSKDTKGKGPANGRKRFQKKTKQVFLVPDEIRQLRREERYPWVIEDSTGKEVWVGKLEEVAQAETRAFFMPAANDVFKFVPAHRWYKFQKKPHYTIWSAEEAEAIASIHRIPWITHANTVWLSKNRKGQGPSSATAAAFKAEAEGKHLIGGNSLVHSAGQSLGPGGRKLKTVDAGMDHLFGDDDEEGSQRRREKELGEEGDLDEVIFEEEFADDEEPVEANEDDEEAKEQAERLKREQKAANKTQEGYIDADEEEQEGALSKDGKRYKKMLRNRDGNDAYDSEEEENPYASSVEEEEEEDMVPVPLADPALQPKPEEQASQNKEQPNNTNGVKSESRPTSPIPPNVGHGGHSVVAKRATSPKAGKPKQTSGSRATSPLASRAGSPSAPGSARASSPNAPGYQATNKRKAADDPSGSPTSPTSPNPNGNPPKLKKRKPLPGAVGELDDKMVIEWLRNTPNATTRDCISYFTPYLTEEAKKAKFTALVKEVAQLKGGVLVLRNAYRTGSAAPSPVPTPVA